METEGVDRISYRFFGNLSEKDKNGQIQKARMIFSAVGSGPVEALEAEKMLRQVFLNDPLIEKVSDQAVKEISPMRTSLHSPAYKRKMAGILLRQALEEVLNEIPSTKLQNPNNTQ